MSIPIRFLPEAREELDRAIDWYEQRQSGLGGTFLIRAQEVLDRISQTPQIHPVIYRDIRQGVLRQFPYVILYREEGVELIVISVFHHSQDPSIWQSRVDP